MSRHGLQLIAIAGALVLVLFGVAGRVEGSRWTDRQVAGIAAARDAVGANIVHPKAYRMSPSFDCLLYGSYEADNARELCFAPSGAIVEAIERHLGKSPM